MKSFQRAAQVTVTDRVSQWLSQ